MGEPLHVSSRAISNSSPVIVPDAWRQLDLPALDGVLLVIGAPDTGKSTFARWLARELAQNGRPVALLDGDVGQSMLGPPTTMTLALPSEGAGWRPLARWFVGDVSPRGHMLPLVVGAGRLARRALEAGAQVIVADTTGLVDRAQGGVALKHALVDQLQPTLLFAFPRAAELNPILNPLRRLPRPRVVELPVLDVVRQRDVERRQSHRAEAYRRYFAGSRVIRLPLRGRAIFEGQAFVPGRLLALQDAAGFTLALAVIEAYDAAAEILSVRTTLAGTDQVASIRLGAIGVDTKTGRDFRPGRG